MTRITRQELDSSLKAELDGKIGKVSININSQDLNNIIDTGFYDGSSVVNAPGTDWFYFEVIRHTNDSPTNRWINQIATSFYTSEQFIRQARGGSGNWSAWSKLPTRVEVDDLKTSVVNGKNSIASAISGKGVAAAGSDDFAALSSKISSIPLGNLDNHLYTCGLQDIMRLAYISGSFATYPSKYSSTSGANGSNIYFSCSIPINNTVEITFETNRAVNLTGIKKAYVRSTWDSINGMDNVTCTLCLSTAQNQSRSASLIQISIPFNSSDYASVDLTSYNLSGNYFAGLHLAGTAHAPTSSGSTWWNCGFDFYLFGFMMLGY